MEPFDETPDDRAHTKAGADPGLPHAVRAGAVLPPIFQELAHGVNLTEKHTRDGVHSLEPEGLFTPAAIVDLRLSLQKPLPTALFHDLPLVGRVMAGKPVEVFEPHQRLPIPPVAAAEQHA
jgi:hypothetical protein